MKELTIYNLTGWMNGLFDISLKDQVFYSKNKYFNINNYFWNELFSKTTLSNTLADAKKVFSVNDNVSDKVLAAINNSDLFSQMVLEAVTKIKSLPLEEKEIFNYLETIQIYCDIYSSLNSSAFKLSIDSGYVCDNSNSKYLYQNCISKNYNPYLEFIEEKVIPVILQSNYEIIWFEGRISIATFAIARLIKQYLPNVFIGISKFSNEYYSLNKILTLLKNNDYFFKVFDCIIIDETQKTRRNTIEGLKNNCISEVPNIIFKNSTNKIIINKTYCINDYDEPEYFEHIDTTSNFPVNIKLFPINHCYWNKCNFCGINRKYLNCNNNSEWNIDQTIDVLKKLSANGVKSFWAIDEAIPIHILNELSNRIINENLNFKWHFRTRIEAGLLDENLVKTLKIAGVSHILLGFESASNKILDSMNKTNLNNYVDIAEKIVEMFTRYEIKVHFPTIIGYPDEKAYDQNITFSFLRQLKKCYKLFSFNINIFYLDIASNVFLEWTKNNISLINLPCEPQCFIGNIVQWNSPSKLGNDELYSIVKREMKFMFPWYPEDALIPINTFYMLLENMKYPLISSEKTDKNITNTNKILKKKSVRFNKFISIFKNSQGLYCVYNLKNHQSVSGGKLIYEIIEKPEINLINIADKYSYPMKQRINELFDFFSNNDFF